MSFIEVLRTRPDVRREYALCWGLLILGYALHGWIDSALVTRMDQSMSPSQASNLGGVLAGGIAVAIAITTGILHLLRNVWVVAIPVTRRSAPSKAIRYDRSFTTVLGEPL